MKLAFLIGGAAGYVLGTRAGRERYEQIVRLARRVGGSQTVQSTAGVFQAQFDTAAHRARDVVASKLHAANGSATTSHEGDPPALIHPR